MTHRIRLSVADALIFAQRSSAPIIVIDSAEIIADHASALTALGRQLVGLEETSGFYVNSTVINVANVLALAPKMTTLYGNLEAFGKITDTADQVAANATQLLALDSQIIPGGLFIQDTANNISAQILALQALGSLIGEGGIHITDTIDNLLANASTLSALGAKLSITITDSVDNINTHLADLLAFGSVLKTLQLPDGTVIAIQSIDDSSVTLDSVNALKFFNAGLATSIHVVDDGWHLNLDALISLDSQLLSVQDSSGIIPFSWPVNVDTLLAIASRMSNVSGFPETFSYVADSAENIVNHSAELRALASQLPTGSLHVTDSVAHVIAHTQGLLTLTPLLSDGGIQIQDTASQVAAFAGQLVALGLLVPTGGVHVFDTAENNLANIEQMGALAQELAITVTDSVAPINSYTTHLLALGSALRQLQLPDGTLINIQSTDGHSITVDSINALHVFNEGITMPLRVIDSADKLNIDALMAMGGALLSVQEISGADTFSTTLSIAEALALAPKMTDFFGNPEIFGNITDNANNFIANASSLLALGGQLGFDSLHIEDNVSHIAALAPQLLALNLPLQTASIHITDTAANLLAHASELAQLGDAVSMTVADSANHINANFNALMALGSSWHSLQLPDGTSISIQSNDGHAVTFDVPNAVNFVNENLTAPFTIADYSGSIAGFEDKLTTMDAQLVAIHLLEPSFFYPKNLFKMAISLENFLALAPKMTDGQGNFTAFNSINASLPDLADHIRQVLALISQISTASGGMVGPASYTRGINLTDTAAQIAHYTGTLQPLKDKLAITVTDSAEHINRYQSELLSLGSALKIFSLPDSPPIRIISADANSVTLGVLNALTFIKEGIFIPLHIIDYVNNTIIDAIAAIGNQLLSIQDNSGYTSFMSPIRVQSLLAVATKMTDYYGNPEVFTNITDTVLAVLAHRDQLLALAEQIPAGSLHITDNAQNVTQNINALLGLVPLLADGGIRVEDSVDNIITCINPLLALGTLIPAGGIHLVDTANNILANASSLSALGSQLSITLSDTADNINANWPALLSLGSIFNGINLPDGRHISLLAVDSQFVTLNADNAFWFAQEQLNAPVHIRDYGWNLIPENLIALGSQLLSVQEISGNVPFYWPLTVNEVLALALKMTDFEGKPAIFDNIRDSAKNIADHASKLLVLGVKTSSSEGGSVDDGSANSGETSTRTTPVIVNIVLQGNSADIADNATALATLGDILSVSVYDTAENINIHMADVVSLGGSLKNFNLPDGTQINVHADGHSLTLDTNNAWYFVHAKLNAPIHIADAGWAMNLDKLTDISDQVFSIQDTSDRGIFDWDISVSNFLVLAPKMTDKAGDLLTFNHVIGSVADVVKNAEALLALQAQMIDGGLRVSGTADALSANANALKEFGSLLSIDVADSADAINTHWAALLSLGSALKGFSLPDGTSISVLSADQQSLTLSAGDAVNFVNEGLAAPLHIVDVGFAMNFDSLALIGSQLLSVNDTFSGYEFFRDTRDDTGSAPYPWSVSVADVLALAPKMTDYQGNPMRFSMVSDTFEAVTTHAEALQALGSQIATKGILIIENADSVANSAPQLALLGNRVAVTVLDTADRINATISQLLTLGNALSGFILPDGTSVFVKACDGLGLTLNTLSAMDWVNAQLTAPIRISDYPEIIARQVSTLANMGAQLLSLQDISGGHLMESAITVSNLLALAPKMTDTEGNAEIFSYVFDTAQAVSEQLDRLQAIAPQISSITLTDTGTASLALSSAQLLNDADVLAKLSGDYQLLISPVSANAFSAARLNSHVRLPLQLADSAVNISAILDSAQAVGAKLASIYLTDAGSPTLSITSAQYFADQSALGKIQADKGYYLSLGNESAAHVARDLAFKFVVSVGVRDSLANVMNAMNTTLLKNVGNITQIHLTNTGTPILALTAAQYSADLPVLNKVTSPYAISIRDETTRKVSNDLLNSHVTRISILDSAANIKANLETDLLANVAKISRISFTNKTPPLLSLSATQLAHDAVVLNKISAPYKLAIFNATASGVNTLVKNSHVTSIAVIDTALNVFAKLESGLLANVDKLSSIAFIDKTPPRFTLNATQFISDAGVLSKISSVYTLNITHSSAAGVAAIAQYGFVTSIQVVDSANHVLSNMASGLLAHVDKLSAIRLSNQNTPSFKLTAMQWLADKLVLNKIDTPYQLSITDEIAAKVAIDASNSHVTRISVKDTASHVMAHLDSKLLPNIAKLGDIALTDASQPQLSLSADQYAADLSVLNKISSPYSITISNETVHHIPMDALNSHVSAIGVMDSAAHVAGNLNTLHVHLNKLSGIRLTDPGTPKLELSSAQIAGHTGVLNRIKTPYLLSVKDTVAAINELDLGIVKTGQIELMPTGLNGSLIENRPITYLNLSLINLSNKTITIQAYHNTGTEVDIKVGDHIAHQLLFIHDKPNELELIGIGSTSVQVF